MRANATGPPYPVDPARCRRRICSTGHPRVVEDISSVLYSSAVWLIAACSALSTVRAWYPSCHAAATRTRSCTCASRPNRREEPEL